MEKEVLEKFQRLSKLAMKKQTRDIIIEDNGDIRLVGVPQAATLYAIKESLGKESFDYDLFVKTLHLAITNLISVVINTVDKEGVFPEECSHCLEHLSLLTSVIRKAKLEKILRDAARDKDFSKELADKISGLGANPMDVIEWMDATVTGDLGKAMEIWLTIRGDLNNEE